MRVFKTKWVVGFARRERIVDATLRAAIARVESGLADADLGGGIVKVRVARAGQGRSGGYRMFTPFNENPRILVSSSSRAKRGDPGNRTGRSSCTPGLPRPRLAVTRILDRHFSGSHVNGVLIAYRAGTRAVFLYGFAKADRGNINADELMTLREIGADWMAADMDRIGRALDAGILQEVSDGPR